MDNISHNEEKIKILPYIIWLVAVLCLLFQFLLQFSSGIMTNQLMETFNLTASRAGFLAGSYYHIYVLLQTPAGFLTDRYGPKRLLSYGAVICCIGCLIFSHSDTFLQAEAGRLLMGGGLSFAFVGMVYITATVLPSNMFSLMIGVAETLAILGALISELYLSSYIDIIGWRVFINAAAVVALVLAALCWFLTPSKEDYNEDNDVAMDVLSFQEVFEQFIDLVKNPIAWANGLYAGFMFAVLTTFHGLWAQPFLIEAYGLGLYDAGHFCSLMLVGASIGFPLAGWLGGKLKETKYLLVFSALAEAITLLAIISFTSMSHYILAILLILAGFFTGAYILSYSISHNIVGAGSKSTSIGFTNTLAVITAPLMQPFIGYLLDLIADGPKYSIIDFQLALGIMPLCLVVAAILACFLPTANKNIQI
ncbi:MAG: MFS transporter [Legionellales bacterium]|jgi:MFS family permease|nr:MFS transporter [Legionellales bacterium]